MKPRHPLRSAVVAVLLVAIVVSGCSRAHYRLQADQQAVTLTDEKANHPHWNLDYFRVTAPEASRMHDPYDPDHEPLPPDDPTAHVLMHKVDGKRGYKHWHKNGDTPFTQNPNYLECLPLNENGILVLSADEAVRQGFLHSPNYQRELETVYLSALDVSFERFRFDTQFFAGYGLDYTATGRDRPGSGGESRSIFEAATGARGIRAERLFATGGELVVGFANSLVWQFSGPDDYAGRTLIDFSLVQPLLRDAGRARVLERLTRAERTLLYNVRAMERYRQAYNVQIITGRDPGGGPNRGGGVFGAGLEGFTGQGAGFGGIQTTAAIGQTSQSGAAQAGAGQAGGYIGLLQQQQQIENQKANVIRLRDTYREFERDLEIMLARDRSPGASDRVLRQRLQVAQSRQALINAQSTLLNAQNTFQQNLDNFKGTLGLPPQLCVAVVDPMLNEFQLIDRPTHEMERAILGVMESFGDINEDIVNTARTSADAPAGSSADSIEWTDELQADLQTLLSRLPRINRLAREMLGTESPDSDEHLEVAGNNIEAYKQRSGARQAFLRRLSQRMNSDRENLCALLQVEQLDESIFNLDRFSKVPDELDQEFERLSTELEGYQERVQEIADATQTLLTDGPTLAEKAIYTQLRDRIVVRVQDLLGDLHSDAVAIQVLQATAKAEAIGLVDVDMRAEQALEVARRYRHDWMNSRAALVDQWRLIEFNANQLEASLDLVFSGDVQNRGDNPFKLAGSTGRLSAGVQFDSPIVRVAERNTYRQTLIEYQQARRAYYQFEDTVARGLRQQLRTLTANQINFELQRSAAVQAAKQVSLNTDIAERSELPAQVTTQSTGGAPAVGATAARDAVSALADLLDAQNNFMSVFVNYEVQRRNLDLDLGTMRLDAEGLWLDPKAIDNGYPGELYPEECDQLPAEPFSDDQINQMIKWFDEQDAKAEELPAPEGQPALDP
jgi:hypothetical protein